MVNATYRNAARPKRPYPGVFLWVILSGSSCFVCMSCVRSRVVGVRHTRGQLLPRRQRELQRDIERVTL